MVQLKMGCIWLPFKYSHFPLNHDYGGKSRPWKSKTKQRMVLRVIHVKDSLLQRGKVWSLDFLGRLSRWTLPNLDQEPGKTKRVYTIATWKRPGQGWVSLKQLRCSTSKFLWWQAIHTSQKSLHHLLLCSTWNINPQILGLKKKWKIWKPS